MERFLANKNEPDQLLRTACILTALVLLLPSRATAEPALPWDPIPVENQSLLHLTFLSMPPLLAPSVTYWIPGQ